MLASTLDSGSSSRVLVWSDDGSLVADHVIQKKVTVFSSATDSDCQLGQLDHAVFLTLLGSNKGSVYTQPANAQPCTYSLEPGVPLQLGGFTWLLARQAENLKGSGSSAASVQASSRTDARSGVGQFLPQLMTWAGGVLSSEAELRSGLAAFLEVVRERAGARSGLLVVARAGDFSLVSSSGSSMADAQTVWQSMPANLTEEILRSGARILLPEGLRTKASGKTTVFVKGIRSVVGFPALAEGRVLAIFYLGFDNLLLELSETLQADLESAATLLGLVIQRALLREQLLDNSTRVTEPASGSGANSTIQRLMVGSSRSMREVYTQIEKLAPFDVPVLVDGETGTGKELAARELHRFSKRNKQNFVALNAAALPENLIESELFGHRRGAFTGALSDHAGLIEQAEGGTLFLDEIGELAPALQSKLLRVLQERSVTRLGESKARPVNFRLVCATHRDLRALIKTKAFREDLYYRIAGANIHLPALRERPGDVLELANFFKARFVQLHGLADKDFSASATATLLQHDWPGNIRELEHLVGRACVMADGLVIRNQDLGIENAVGEEEPPSESGEENLMDARDRWMKMFLMGALKRHDGNRTRTAKALGIGERTLFRYLEQFDLRGH